MWRLLGETWRMSNTLEQKLFVVGFLSIGFVVLFVIASGSCGLLNLTKSFQLGVLVLLLFYVLLAIAITLLRGN